MGKDILGKVPPQDVKLESAVLGAILIETGAYLRASNLINQDVFYKEAHRLIFAACSALFSKSEPIDLLTVTAQLRASNSLETAGGAYYLVELTNEVNSSANMEYHASILLDMWLRRTLINSLSRNVEEAFDLTTDVFSSIEKTQLELIKAIDVISKKKAESVYSKMQEVLETASNIVVGREKGEVVSSGYLTGCEAFDQLTGGKTPSNLIILAARPSAGKTAKMLEEARSMALNGVPTLIYSLEMSSYEMALRLVSIETGITNSDVKRGNMTHEQINEAAKLIKKWENTGLYIDDSSSLSIAEIRSKTIIAYQKLGVRKVYIDYLQLCKGTGFNREQEISSVSRGLKNLAKELNIPVTALAQLSREVEKRADKRPQLSDLRESGSIEQDADMVQFLFRPEYYGITQFEDGSDAEKKLVNIIAKNRNGATTDIVEYCDIACGRIGDKWQNLRRYEPF
jgi:replicative DNA helicase